MCFGGRGLALLALNNRVSIGTAGERSESGDVFVVEQNSGESDCVKEDRQWL